MCYKVEETRVLKILDFDMVVIRPPIFIGMVLVLIMQLDNNISLAFIIQTTPRLATSTKAPEVCNEIYSPANGNISYSNNSLVVKTTVKYTCNAGYELDGTNIRTCTQNGIWSGADSSCRLKVCNETKTPANGNTSYSNNSRVVNTTVTYTCNVGYELVGTNNRTCTTKGTWDGADPTCNIKVCATADIPANGSVSYSDESRIVGTKVMYICYDGYKLNGTDTSTCTEEGKWDGADPRCDLIVCNEIYSPANGNISYSNNSLVVKTTVTYTCNAGYELDGTNIRTCTQNGIWSGADSSCRLKVCNETKTPANGNTSYSNNSRVVNTTVTYTCNVGYELLDTNSRRCTTNGTWDGADPTCNIKVCATADIPANGIVSYSDESRIVGTKVMYICYDGYKLNGTDTSTCTEEGKWDSADPRCDVIVCDDVFMPSYGTTSYSSDPRVVNTTVTYNCTAGYELIGTDTRTCTVEGTWDYVDPQCDLIVRGYNDTCTESVPDGQCSTVNSSCLDYGDGTGYRCRCTVEDYHHLANNSCLKRPSSPIEMEFTIPEGNELITTSGLFVSWTGSKQYPDFRIVIDWKSSQNNTIQTFKRAWGSLNNFNVFKDLESGTEYTFFLYLEKETIRTVLLANVSGYTKPESVHTISFEEVWEKNFTVVWDNDPARSCKSYDLSLDTEKHVTIPRTNDTSQRYTFTNLTGRTRYVVTITARVPGRSSEPLNNASYSRPEPVMNVTVTQVLSNAVTLQLTGPETPKDGYKIYVTPNISDSVENPITSQYDVKEIGGLALGIEHMFKVYTYINNLESEQYLTVSAYTRPMSPDDLTVQGVLEDSLRLHWTLPESNSFDEYILEYRTTDSQDVDVSLPFNKTSVLQYSVQNLTLGTGSVFNLYTVVNDVRSNEPATIFAYTRPEGPGIPAFKQRFETSIVIEFPSNLNSYDGYQICGKVYESGNDTITITDLKPGTDYTFTIFTVANSTVTSLNNITFESFTRPTHPTTANFPVVDLHETSLTVTWDAVTNGSVGGYLVFLSKTNMPFNGSSEITTASFSNLTTGTKHTVNIYSYWRGEESDNSLEQTIYTRPTAPRGYISHVTESTLTLAFNESGVMWPNFMIKVTSVSYIDPRTINVSLDEFPFEIDALTAGTKYTVEVYSIVDVIVGENALILSSYTKREAVRLDTITPDPSLTNSSVLSIIWALPTEGSVDWYEIQYECKSPNDPTNMVSSYTNRSNTTTSSVSGLDPGTVCTVNITSHIGNQHGATTQKRIDWSTDENAPDKVRNMNVETGARNLTVTWNIPLAPNGVIREYRVDVVDLKENCIKSRTIFMCSNCSNSSNPQCGQAASSQVSTFRLCGANETKPFLEAKEGYDHRVSDLHPYRNYKVEITPFTRCYGTTMSVSKLTQQAAPTGVPINGTQSMSGTTNTTLSLTWYPPLEEQQNGIITEYTVYIRYYNRTCYGKPEGNEVKKQITVNSTVGEVLNNVAIPDLYPFWVYPIAVSASTSAGEGPKTADVNMMTNQSPPGVIRSSPQVTDKSSTSIYLKWEHPCYVNGIIKCYRIQVISLDDQDTVSVYETLTNETKYTISGLKPYHNYTVSVAAMNTENQIGPALNTTGVLRTNTEVSESKGSILQGANTVTIVVTFISGIGITLVAVGIVIYLKRRRAACFARRERNATHGMSETIDGTEMVTKTSANKVLRNPSEEEECDPYDFIGNHDAEDRSAYYNVDRNQYDVLERSNDPSHEYGTLTQNGEHKKTNGKMYENLRISPTH